MPTVWYRASMPTVYLAVEGPEDRLVLVDLAVEGPEDRLVLVDHAVHIVPRREASDGSAGAPSQRHDTAGTRTPRDVENRGVGVAWSRRGEHGCAASAEVRASLDAYGSS